LAHLQPVLLFKDSSTSDAVASDDVEFSTRYFRILSRRRHLLVLLAFLIPAIVVCVFI